MGQAHSRKSLIDLKSLIKTENPIIIKRSQSFNATDLDKYTVTIPLPKTDDIISEILISDDNYKKIDLTVGTHVFNGVLDNNGNWYFNCSIPLFKIPDETCHFTIYTLKEETPTITLYYNGCFLKQHIKSPIMADGLIYQSGMVI